MDKMREEFEKWCTERYGYTEKRFEMYLGEYTNGKTYDKWAVWKASRAALVVELPPNRISTDVYMEDEVKVALDKAGIKYE